MPNKQKYNIGEVVGVKTNTRHDGVDGTFYAEVAISAVVFEVYRAPHEDCPPKYREREFVYHVEELKDGSTGRFTEVQIFESLGKDFDFKTRKYDRHPTVQLAK